MSFPKVPMLVPLFFLCHTNDVSQIGLGGTENFYLWLLQWDGHAIIANIAMSGLISQIIDIIGWTVLNWNSGVYLEHVLLCCS